jgi:glycosyltransferase involved in cell wall biosynthesis
MSKRTAILQTEPKALYSSFDLFPSRKGAAIHINKFAGVLFEQMGDGLLHVIGNEKLPVYQLEKNVEIVRFNHVIKNYLKRALAFSEHLTLLLDECSESLEICHFRDIWSGLAILGRNKNYKTLYEINGLTSIELPFVYQNVSPGTIAKLFAQEKLCMENCDHIVTPSQTIREKILSYGIKENKITVIPNGAVIPEKSSRPPGAPDRFIIYFGAVQAWQGVDVLLKAFARLADLSDLYLVICSSNHSRRSKLLKKLAEKLGIEERMIWHYGLNETELTPWLQHAEISIAPLTECSRNIEQGCSPLKILESMAAGVPVIASDLPAVRELMKDQEHGRLINPDRPGELARTIRVLLQYPELLKKMGNNGQHEIEQYFLWERSLNQLRGVYRDILT